MSTPDEVFSIRISEYKAARALVDVEFTHANCEAACEAKANMIAAWHTAKADKVQELAKIDSMPEELAAMLL